MDIESVSQAFEIVSSALGDGWLLLLLITGYGRIFKKLGEEGYKQGYVSSYGNVSGKHFE